MAYAAITAMLAENGEIPDERSNLDWVNAMLFMHYRELWNEPPEGFKERLAGLLDAAEARGRKRGMQEMALANAKI